MFRALYDWTLRLAGHRHAMRYMAGVSFCESSFFPIPPDVMLVPMMLARREQAYRIALVCTIASVLGGILGYFLYDSVGRWLINLYGAHDGLAEMERWYAQWGAAVILVKGLTPIPFKIVTIASGFFQYNFLAFVVLATITRGARFYLIAWLLKRYGAPVQAFIERRMNLIGTALLVALVGGFAAIRFI